MNLQHFCENFLRPDAKTPATHCTVRGSEKPFPEAPQTFPHTRKQNMATPKESPYLYIIHARALDAHLLKEPACTANLINDEKHIADVADDVAAERLVELDVAHS